jgi:signal transduction histidine kinase
MRVLDPLLRGETYRAVLYQLAQLVLGTVGFVLLVVGWTTTLLFAITPLVVPLLIGLRTAVGGLAEAQAATARTLIGVRTQPRLTSPAEGFWARGFAALRDPAFWRQQAHLLVVWPIALVAVSLLGWAGQLITLPLWYRDSEDVLGFIEIDSLAESLSAAAAGLVLVVVLAHLVGPLTTLSRRLALLLLDSDRAPRPPEQLAVLRRRALTITSLIATFVVALLILIWALTGRGYFWPIWPMLSLGLVVGIFAAAMLVEEHPEARRLAGGSKALAIQVAASVVLVLFLVAVWAFTTRGYFWPIWPALGLALLAAIHGAFVYAENHHRIEELEVTRAGAVDVQETELRRIERDLHDGAQARLVALGMSLGLAEQQLETDPEAVRALLAEARLGAAEALEELRDLARGIHPPILSDRGLEAALNALVGRSPVPVSLSVDIGERPPPAVETAAYFTVAEALANATKHAAADRVEIRVERVGGLLVAEVVDNGKGGADPSGPGLTGLRQRAAALDGALRVVSPPGGPTTVRAELPCAS